MDNKGYIIIWDWRFFVVVGIIILICWVYPSTENGENLEEEIIYQEEKPNINPEAYYWNELPIHYYFSEDYPCKDIRYTQVLKAFDIIEERTDKIVTFYEEKDTHGIEISCYEIYESEEASAYGGIENYYGEKEILSGFIELYKPDPYNFETCPIYPSLTLHEILHAMGFDHIDSRKSIMNPIDGCEKLDDEIVDCLKHIYSNGQENYTCDDIPFME